MLEYLIDNIFVEFAEEIFQQMTCIPIGTNCVPLLADLFLFSYEAVFIQGPLKANIKHTFLLPFFTKQFNFAYRYIGKIVSMNSSNEVIYLRDLKSKKHLR